MSQKLFDNEYGFSVSENNPFFIFPYLQKKAHELFPESQILDLSRGDPGLGFAPAEKSRKFYSFLVAVDTYLNSNISHFRMHLQSEDDAEKVDDIILNASREVFSTKQSEEHMKTLDEVVKKIQGFAKEEGEEISRFKILKEIFKFSTLCGGSYHTPWGEPLVKLVVAGMYRKLLDDQEIHSDNLLFTLGVNDAIGTLFKMLDGIGYLKKGDTVAASTPAYAPYFNEMNTREYDVVEIAMDPRTGDLDLEELEKNTKKIKVFFLITPNNPAGVKYGTDQLKKIAEIAEKNDALIITDEIYAQFFKDFDTIWKYAKKRTLRLCGRSKIERSPGIRFGDVLISNETQDYLSHVLLKDYINAPDFKTQLVWSKAPGGNFGSFQHTASVPGPSQILGMLHILLGEEEQKQYVEMVDKNMDEFFRILEIPRNNKMYYGVFNLNDIPNTTKKEESIDKKMYELCTKYGVILIPAMKFFSEKSQKADDKSNYVRVSLPNLSFTQVSEAAKRIKKYLTE